MLTVLGNSLYCNCDFRTEEFTTQELHNAWKHVRQSEVDNQLRVARYTGYIEGRFMIKAPDVWKRRKGRVFEDYKQVIVDKEFDDRSKAKLTLSSDSEVGNLEFFDSQNSENWTHELSDIAPQVMFGPAVLHSDLTINDSYVFIFGQLSSVFFLRVLNRADGKELLHFAFSNDSDENLGKRGLY
jgi:hypothetical protein